MMSNNIAELLFGQPLPDPTADDQLLEVQPTPPDVVEKRKVWAAQHERLAAKHKILSKMHGELHSEMSRIEKEFMDYVEEQMPEAKLHEYIFFSEDHLTYRLSKRTIEEPTFDPALMQELQEDLERREKTLGDATDDDPTPTCTH